MNWVKHAPTSSIASPVKGCVDDRIRVHGDMSGTLVTESDSNNDSMLDDGFVIDAAASDLLDSLQAIDDRKSVGSWKSETSIHFGSSSCTSTQSDFSTSDSDSALDLEEALMQALFADNESIESPPSELIVPYPDESGSCQRRPMPWDSSSSDSTNGSAQMLPVNGTGKSIVIKETGVLSRDPPVSDNQPLVPRRRRSCDALSDTDVKTQLDVPRQGSNDSCENEMEKLQTFLMMRLPSSIVSKLDSYDWSRICLEMANFTHCSSALNDTMDHQIFNCTDAQLSCGKDDAESCSIKSELTGATEMIESTELFEEKNEEAETTDTNANDDISPLTSPTAHREKLSSHLNRRAWHDSSKCLGDAPIMPIRRGHYPLNRTISEPRSQHNAPWSFSRSSSLPTGLVSVNRRSVSFDTVQIRHYEPVLDLNPSTSCGPSLGIGWNYFVDAPKKVTDAEDLKDRYGRRSMREMIIPRHVREQTLKDCGYTAKDIAKAVRMNLKSKGQRMQTIHNYKLDQIVERSSRKMRRLFNPRSSSRYHPG